MVVVGAGSGECFWLDRPHQPPLGPDSHIPSSALLTLVLVSCQRER